MIAPLAAGTIFLSGAGAQNAGKSAHVKPGQGAFNDWSNEQPGKHYLVRASDLPKPYVTESFANQSEVVPRPANAWPKVPEGFKIDQALTGLEGPRTIVTAPNGDLFVAESNPGRIRVIRGFATDGRVETNEVFASGPDDAIRNCVLSGGAESPVRLHRKHKFDRAFPIQEWRSEGQRSGRNYRREHPRRARYSAADTGRAAWCSPATERNCWSASDPNPMWATTQAETNRADVLEFNPDGSGQRIYASGIRNAAGLTIRPEPGSCGWP